MAKSQRLPRKRRSKQRLLNMPRCVPSTKAEHNYAALQALPRNASPVRAHSRDELDGRPHAYMRKFKMSRLNFRDLAHKGQIPGVRKASW